MTEYQWSVIVALCKVVTCLCEKFLGLNTRAPEKELELIYKVANEKL